MKVLISLEGASPQTDIVRNLTPLEFRDLLSKPAWAPGKYWVINRDEVPEIKSFEEFKKKVTE